jgi:alpha/beta superfamily hydrolase
MYGGTRESHVVRAVARALVAERMAALTFDFRGAGESAGESMADHTEWMDAVRALDTLEDSLPPGTPMAICGYSFGAWVALHVGSMDPRVRAVAAIAPGASLPTDMGGRPVGVAHPEHDHITPVEVIADWMASVGGGELAVVHGADHYLRDEAGDVARQIAVFLARALAGGSPLESGA